MNLRFRALDVGESVVLLTCLNLAVYHFPLYRYAIANLDLITFNSVMTFITMLVVVFVFTALFLFALSLISQKLIKPFCMLAVLLNSCAVYFVINYHVVLDKTMMGNIFNTRSEESLVFFNPNMLLYFVLLGMLPAWLISKLQILPVRRLRVLVQAFGLVLAGILFIYINSSTWLWFDKHSKMLGGVIMPWSYSINAIRAQVDRKTDRAERILLPDAISSNDDKTLVVLVVGETARAHNFSLYGYDRQTNPLLSQADIAVLKNTTSCSTYTTASLHCMLTHSGKTSGKHETLPAYLQRHNVDVIWRTNNWGEPWQKWNTYQKAADLRTNCIGVYCPFDDVMLTGLKEQIENSAKNKIFVTLHSKGSHGPAYYTRYPPEYEVFTPVCESVELHRCSEKSLVNAYDNTIVYTDSFLYRVIETLESMNDIPSVFIYVSDHGESLGEYGLYLHGTPYSIAPDFQKNIPFLVWMSDEFQTRKGVSHELLEQAQSHTHGHVFHSILGALNMESQVYKQELDVFAQ